MFTNYQHLGVRIYLMTQRGGGHRGPRADVRQDQLALKRVLTLTGNLNVLTLAVKVNLQGTVNLKR